MSQISACGTVRVQAINTPVDPTAIHPAAPAVVLNVFGTYATFDEEQFNSLMDALEDAAEEAGFDLD